MITCVNMILIQVYVCKSGWCLVVEAYPLKHMKLIGMMTFITGGKMKNVPNHQPVYENIDQIWRFEWMSTAMFDYQRVFPEGIWVAIASLHFITNQLLSRKKTQIGRKYVGKSKIV